MLVFIFIAIFVDKLTNFREEIYQSTKYFSVNDHWNPTILIAKTKLGEVRNILRRWNDTNVPDVLKLQASEVGSTVKKYPIKAQNPEKVIED